MSCTTLYLHVDGAGRVTGGAEKYGPLPYLDPMDVRRVMRAQGLRPLDFAPGGWCCRGVLLDDRRRCFRIYQCYGNDDHTLALARWLRTAEVWRGWDAGVEPGWAAGLGARAGLWPAPMLEDPPPLASLLEGVLGPTGAGERDEARWAFRFDSADPFLWSGAPGVISIVDAQGRAREVGLSSESDVVSLLRHGPEVLARLEGAWPMPVDSAGVRAGAWIRPGRLGWWTRPGHDTRVAAAIRAAWAGWEVVEEQHGLLGQLRAAGVEAPEELPSERPPPPLTWELPPLQAARRPGFEFG